MSGATYICGGDMRPGKRDLCPNTLHDWPLPSGYVDAGEVAHSRLYRKWGNVRCPDCGIYGWVPGVISDGDTRVPATGVAVGSGLGREDTNDG